MVDYPRFLWFRNTLTTGKQKFHCGNRRSLATTLVISRWWTSLEERARNGQRDTSWSNPRSPSSATVWTPAWQAAHTPWWIHQKRSGGSSMPVSTTSICCSPIVCR